MNPQSEDRVQSPEFWDRVVQLFHFALALGPTERVAYLRDAKATESDVVAEVESLICEHEQTGSFLDSPAYRAALEAANQRSTINLRRTGDDSQSLIGRVIGRYRVTRVIGRGGMGVVYLAHDASLGRNVALKLLPPEYTEDEERLRRFKHEARAASALNHPNILTVHELGEVEGIHFIAAEFVEGTTLRDRIRGQAMKLSDAVDVAVQVANALEAAHSAGIIHRDIKPENIMLRSDGIVKVLDFGIAKLVERKGMLLESEALTVPYLETTKGVVLGTPRYMSPEQTRGLALDGRTDIFSLGAVLYEIITGQSPFAGETLEDLRASI
ncbi:MAG TPA: serine/threonine-protein kinase, partial [Blastocatellia bacterium]|nr:serine/threonine-protein kinase [Blastocatellia bacterium]